MPMPGIAPPCLMGGRAQAKATLVGNEVSNTAGSSFSFSGVDFGAADADRYLLLIANAWSISASSLLINSATIGGVAAGRISIPDANSTLAGPVAAFIRQVPTGASGVVSFALNTSASRASISLWALTKLREGGVPTDTGIDPSSPHSLSLNCPVGGVAIGAAFHEGAHAATTWTGLDGVATGLASREFAAANAAHAIAGAISGASARSLIAISFK